ncbi:hypothetical protein [Amaricoccus solimangrovi]|uniref:Uncharacterized protein n=1 Tax=Amaricoccus solimangrovi TaxID=2589815 RepID=A0A501WYT5_9RHOB|nr:hypothetical protein [Amaricoccus solimangrovi]TPE53830.1 hypothetical protein FJM51_01935 [Amaricoccus solimangrovi]
MGVLTDGLLLAATLFAGTYCWVLARRVDALRDLDRGLGGAITRLTRQIELARATLDEARAGTRASRQDLAQLSARAEAAAGKLRLLLAAVNEPDAPDSAGATPPPDSAPPAPPRPAPLRATRDCPPAADLSTAPVPKPRGLPATLRPRTPAEEKGEAEILAALGALAGGEG